MLSRIELLVPLHVCERGGQVLMNDLAVHQSTSRNVRLGTVEGIKPVLRRCAR